MYSPFRHLVLTISPLALSSSRLFALSPIISPFRHRPSASRLLVLRALVHSPSRSIYHHFALSARSSYYHLVIRLFTISPSRHSSFHPLNPSPSHHLAIRSFTISPYRPLALYIYFNPKFGECSRL